MLFFPIPSFYSYYLFFIYTAKLQTIYHIIFPSETLQQNHTISTYIILQHYKYITINIKLKNYESKCLF